MSDTDDDIDVWYVTPDKSGLQARIVFDDQQEAIEYAEEVLEVLFDGLGEEDSDTLTVERGKMKRSVYDNLENTE
jgi:predicted nucleotidyltransferase